MQLCCNIIKIRCPFQDLEGVVAPDGVVAPGLLLQERWRFQPRQAARPQLYRLGGERWPVAEAESRPRVNMQGPCSTIAAAGSAVLPHGPPGGGRQDSHQDSLQDLPKTLGQLGPALPVTHHPGPATESQTSPTPSLGGELHLNELVL